MATGIPIIGGKNKRGHITIEHLNETLSVCDIPVNRQQWVIPLRLVAELETLLSSHLFDLPLKYASTLLGIPFTIDKDVLDIDIVDIWAIVGEPLPFDKIRLGIYPPLDYISYK